MKRLKPLPKGYDKHAPREAVAEKDLAQGNFRWAWGHTTDVVVEVEADVEIDIFAPVCFDGYHLRAAADLPGRPEKNIPMVAETFLGVAANYSPLSEANVIRVQTTGVFTCEPHGDELIAEGFFVGLRGNTVTIVNDIRQAIGRGLGVSRGLFSTGDWLVEIGIGGPPFLAKEFRTMTTDLTLQQRMTSVRQMFETHKNQIALALPRNISADRMLRVALTAVQRTPQLLECDQRSLFGAVIQSSQLGLECDGVQGLAYLVPFGNKKKGTKEVQLIIGWRGLMALARRSGEITTITAEVVHANDRFEVAHGLSPKLTHEPPMKGERGEVIGFYAVGHYKTGEAQFRWMTKAEVDAIRNSSASARSSSSPWKSHYIEMGKKTAVRALCKMLPASVELQRAEALESQVADGIGQDLGEMLPVAASTPAIEAESTPAEPVPEEPTANVGNLAEALAAVYAADNEKAVEAVVDKAKMAWTLDPPEIAELDEAAAKRKAVLRGDGAVI